jgi:DNA-binding CsgD family transcriptional regulator
MLAWWGLRNRRLSLICRSLGTVVAVLGLIGGYFGLLGDLTGQAVLASGLLMGIGLSVLAVFWSDLLGLLSEPALLRSLAVAGLIAGSTKLMLLLVQSGAVTLVIVVLSLLLTGFLPVQRLDEHRDIREHNTQVSVGLLRIVRGIWIPFFGFLLCVVIISCMWSAQLAEKTIWINPGIASSSGMASGFTLASLLYLLAANNLLRRQLSLAYLVVPLSCIALLLLVPQFGNFNEVWSTMLSSIPLGFSLQAISILFGVRLIEESRYGVPSTPIVGVILASYMLVFLIILSVWPVLGDALADALTQSSMVLFLLACAVSMTAKVIRGGMMASAETGSFQASDDNTGARDDLGRFEVNCESIRTRFGLSSREDEILKRFALGHSAPYIADELFLSVNTVRTHLKHIYAKTDVHTREELLELIHAG